MRIAGITSNKNKILIAPFFHIWASKYNPKGGYYFNKPHYRKEPAKISIHNSRLYDGGSKIIRGEFVFPNARKLSSEAEDFITAKELVIESLRKEITSYISEHYDEWELLSLKDAFELIYEKKVFDNGRTKEQHWQSIEEVMAEIRSRK